MLKLDSNRILMGMGLLIGLYLLGRNGNMFDRLFTRLSSFIQNETSVLQGNPPFPVTSR